MKSFFVILAILLAIDSVYGLNKQEDCKCKVLASSRIVGGKTSQQIYPWMVTFFLKVFQDSKNLPVSNIPDSDKLDRFLCQGVIINERTILTSAMCEIIRTNDSSKQYLDVAFGSNDLIELFDHRYKVAETIPHPNLTFPKFPTKPVNDLSIVILEEPIKFTKNVGPACFNPEDVRQYTGVLSTIGFGHAKAEKHNIYAPPPLDRGWISERFLKEINVVDVTQTETTECSFDGLICAKGKTAPESPCVGDHGGPLMETKNGKTAVIGITSIPSMKFIDDENFIICLGDEPTIYTRVSKFWNWIQTHIGDDYCPLV